MIIVSEASDATGGAPDLSEDKFSRGCDGFICTRIPEPPERGLDTGDGAIEAYEERGAAPVDTRNGAIEAYEGRGAAVARAPRTLRASWEGVKGFSRKSSGAMRMP